MKLKITAIFMLFLLSAVATADDKKSEFDEVRDECSRYSDMAAVLWGWIGEPMTYVSRGRALVEDTEVGPDRNLAELIYLFTYEVGNRSYNERTKQQLIDDIRTICISGLME